MGTLNPNSGKIFHDWGKKRHKKNICSLAKGIMKTIANLNRAFQFHG